MTASNLLVLLELNIIEPQQSKSDYLNFSRKEKKRPTEPRLRTTDLDACCSNVRQSLQNTIKTMKLNESLKLWEFLYVICQFGQHCSALFFFYSSWRFCQFGEADTRIFFNYFFFCNRVKEKKKTKIPNFAIILRPRNTAGLEIHVYKYFDKFMPSTKVTSTAHDDVHNI